MTKQEQAGAKPKTETQSADRSPARSKQQGHETKQKDDDLPGAEGPNSAGANEDTYD